MRWKIWVTKEKLVLLSSLLELGFGFETKWKSKLPQWNTGRVYMISYNIYGVERYGLLCNGNRNFKIEEIVESKFGNLICKDNGFQKLDFISSNQKEYFDFITGNVIPFINRPAKIMCRFNFMGSRDLRYTSNPKVFLGEYGNNIYFRKGRTFRSNPFSK